MSGNESAGAVPLPGSDTARHASKRLATVVKLSHDHLERLLASLDSDRERAGEAYERIRRKLIQFFEWRGGEFPEDLADQTIDRVSLKLERGEVIRANNPASYFYGVAQNILREHWTSRRREIAAMRASPRNPAALSEESAALAVRMRCLERCLAGMPLGTRELLIRYYQGQARSKIENRKQLAGELGVALTALRNRTQRLRVKLESCVQECLKRSTDMDFRVPHRRREDTF